MAKIVIAGEANCPYYAKIELLADSLQKNLPDLKLHKIVKHPNEWQSWLMDVCIKRGFQHNKSPIVWRELVDRGGKGMLIGGANEFQEYVHGYYGLKSLFSSEDMRKISSENQKTKDEVDEEERSFRDLVKPVNVCITNASSPICYNIMSSIAKGEGLGLNTDISVMLLDTEDQMSYLEGLKMEVYDLACPLLRDVTLTSDPIKAFTDASLIVLMDEVERLTAEDENAAGDGDDKKEKTKTESVNSTEKEPKKDWLKRNNDHFVNYAKIINEKAKHDVKVIVGGFGPVNFNAYMMLQHMPNVARQNVVALSRMVENHAKAVVAERLKVNSADVCDITVWGHSNDEHYIDMSKARVHRYNGAIWGPPSFSLPVTEMIHDVKWLQTEFLELIKKRSKTVETALGHKASASRAAAITSLIQHWWNTSPPGQIFSLGVQSEGWYGVPEGLVFSFPVKFHSAGYWTVIQDIDLSEEGKAQLELIVKDLISEKEAIYPPPYVAPSTPPPNGTSAGQQTDGNTKSSSDSDEIPLGEDGPSLGRIAEDKEGEAMAATEVTVRVKDPTEDAEKD